MTVLEKVEKLVDKTGVSYEDAKAALEQAGGDILDAIIILEKEGKTATAKASTYSTQYEQQTQYVSVPTQVENTQKSYEGEGWKETGRKAKSGIKRLWHFLCTNYFVVTRRGELMTKLPLWLFAVLMLCFWHVGLILIIISLFYGYTYSFKGEADMDAANQFMDKASTAAEKVKEEYRKL